MAKRSVLPFVPWVVDIAGNRERWVEMSGHTRFALVAWIATHAGWLSDAAENFSGAVCRDGIDRHFSGDDVQISAEP